MTDKELHDRGECPDNCEHCEEEEMVEYEIEWRINLNKVHEKDHELR